MRSQGRARQCTPSHTGGPSDALDDSDPAAGAAADEVGMCQATRRFGAWQAREVLFQARPRADGVDEARV
jgi:hypothetical protein